MSTVYTALSGGAATTNGGLGGGQYSSASNVGTFTPSNGAGLVQKAYDRLVEFALRSQPLLRSVADKRPARQSMPGSSVVFQIYNDMSKATTALSEQVDPDSVAIGTPTAVTVTLNEYGNAVLTTRKLQLFSLADVDPAIANIVAFNMADSIDEIVQTELRGGTNVIYASNASGTRATATTNVTGAHTLKSADIRLAVAKLRAGKAVARKGSLYWVGIHPEVSHDLRAESGSASWRLPHEYQANAEIWAGEIGTYEGAYFVESPRLYNATDGGSSARVFRTLVCGQQALAEAVAEEPHVVIGNVTDKLMRLRPIGWYGVLGFKRYREEALYRIESSSSINVA
jgi:N4-gp56 family major capsid protein